MTPCGRANAGKSYLSNIVEGWDLSPPNFINKKVINKKEKADEVNKRMPVCFWSLIKKISQAQWLTFLALQTVPQNPVIPRAQDLHLKMCKRVISHLWPNTSLWDLTKVCFSSPCYLTSCFYSQELLSRLLAAVSYKIQTKDKGWKETEGPWELTSS